MLKYLYKKYENIDKRKVFKIIVMLVIVYVTFSVFENIVNADILDAIGEPGSFKGLIGEGKYLQSPYRSNYYLDVKELGLTDLFNKFTNWTANLLWSGATILTYILLVVFNLGFSMDIADMFKGILDTIMTALKTTIFDEYFLLLVSIAVIYVAISFVRNNLGQVFSRLGYIVLTTVLMLAATMYSADIVSGITTLSKSIGASSIVAISDRESTEANIGQVSGELWGNLVHRPWLELEFDGRQNEVENLDGVIDKILSMPDDSEERQKYIDELNKNNPELFKENAGTGRILPAFLILLVNLVKMGVMIVLSIIQIVFQIVTILFVLAFPFILLLSISPSFGGASLLSNLGNQILGAQVGIVLTSFLLGLMIKLDGLIATYLGGLGTYGWFAITIIQAAIYIGVIWQRKQIFRLLMSIQSKISRSSAGVWRNVIKTTDKGVDAAKDAGGNAAGYVSDKIRNGVNNFKESAGEKANKFGDKVRDFHEKHFDKETLGDKVRNYNKAREKERERENAQGSIKNNISPNRNVNIKDNLTNKGAKNDEAKDENIERLTINNVIDKIKENNKKVNIDNKDNREKARENINKIKPKDVVNNIRKNNSTKGENIKPSDKEIDKNISENKYKNDEVKTKDVVSSIRKNNLINDNKINREKANVIKENNKNNNPINDNKINKNIKSKSVNLSPKQTKVKTNISSVDRAKMFNDIKKN